MPKKASTLVRIGEIERMFDISKSKLNFYISMRLLREAGRSPSGHRLFDAAETGVVLDRIKRLRNQGKSIEAIRDVLDREKRG